MFMYISIIWKCYLCTHFISAVSLFFFFGEDKRTKKLGFIVFFSPSFMYFSVFTFFCLSLFYFCCHIDRKHTKRIKMKKSSTCNCINKFHLQQVVARNWDFFYLLPIVVDIAMCINFSDDEWVSEWVREWERKRKKI